MHVAISKHQHSIRRPHFHPREYDPTGIIGNSRVDGKRKRQRPIRWGRRNGGRNGRRWKMGGSPDLNVRYRTPLIALW